MKFRNLHIAVATASLLGLGAAGTVQAGHPDVRVQLSWGIPAYHAYHYGYAPMVVAPPYGQFVYQHYDRYPGWRMQHHRNDGRGQGHSQANGWGHGKHDGGYYNDRRGDHAQDRRHGRDDD